MYYHEFGQDDGSTNPPSAISANIESSQLDLEQGDKFALIQKVIPDVTFKDSTANTPVLNMTVKATNAPGINFNETSSSNVTRTATSPVEAYTDQLHIRLRGRAFAFKIESSTTGVMWRLGVPRLEVRPDGRR